MTILGVDYSWGRPDPHCLAAKGYRFVSRYLSYDTTGKNITAAEAGSLHSAGLDVVLNWEWGKYDARQGYDLGGRQARDAGVYADHVGAPGNLPIYFSMDWDVQPHEYAAVGSYFQAINKVLGAARVGAYGGIRIIDYLYTHRLARWLWQTYAWSGNSIHPQAHVYQYSNGHSICGADVDLDRALRPQFGQWPGAGSSQIVVDVPATPAASSTPFDYTGEIAATSAGFSRLNSTLDSWSGIINGIRNG